MTATVNRRTTVHRGRTFTFDLENISLSNGATVDLEVIRHPGASAIVPVLDPDTVLLLRQYRHAVGNTIIEIPAGTVDADETPESCAKRELMEETGFSGGHWERLGEIVPVPGYSDERIHLFLASSLKPDHQDLDHDELIEVFPVPWDQALRMVFQGEIQDAKSITGLLLAAQRTGHLSVPGLANPNIA